MSSKTALAVCLALTCYARAAHAFTIQSVVTEGCHERITSEALREVRADEPALEAIVPNDDEQALIDDLQFTPEDDMLDLAAVTLLLGVRDNDLKGRGADELDELAQVHGNPEAQDEHCLRAMDQDEPGGSEDAIAKCRAFIERRVEQALDELTDDGQPDPDARLVLPIHLAIRGGIDVPLPAFYVRMGQALHTLQDGFSHTYRTADGERVTVALNWLDMVGRTLDEADDGPPHLDALDACDDADALRRTRRELATRASTELLRAALEPGTRDERMARVRSVLDSHLAFQPGCTFENAWCDAAEASYEASACGCRSVADGGSGAGPIGLALAAALMALCSRRRWPVAGALAIAMLPAVARAQEPDSPRTTTEVIPSADPDKPPITATQTTDGEKTTTTVTVPAEKDEAAPPPPNIVPVAEPGPSEPNALAFGAALTASGSIDKPGFAGALGARLRLHKHWAIGIDGEWNPWISLTGGEPVRSGAANIYASGFLRFPLVYEQFNLRSQLSLGTSVLLSDLYGAPKGSAGLFIGANFLGLEIKASDAFYLIVNPLGVAIPIPQLEGVPFVYPQYRLQLALEFYAG